MSIRSATQKDIPAMLDLGELLHSLSSYRRYSFDRQKVADLLSSVMRGSGVVFVAEKDVAGVPTVVGGLAGGVTEFWFGHDLHGFDYSFFVAPDHRHGITALRLLVAFEVWCKRRGANEVRIGITTGMDVDKTAAFYERYGYTKNGALFTKELPDGS